MSRRVIYENTKKGQETLVKLAKQCLIRPMCYDHNGKLFGMSRGMLERFHKHYGLPAHKDVNGTLRFIPFEVAIWLNRLDQARDLLRINRKADRLRIGAVIAVQVKRDLQDKGIIAA